MKNRILGLIAVFVVAGSLMQTAVARPPHGERMLERMSEQLSLSEEQVSGIKTLFEQKMESKQNFKDSRAEIEALIESGDTEAAADLAAEQARQRVLTQAEFLSGVKGILSAEQYENWKAMRANYIDRGHRRNF